MSDLADRLDNDIRELRGAEPGELARRLIERGWTQAPSEPEPPAANDTHLSPRDIEDLRRGIPTFEEVMSDPES